MCQRCKYKRPVKRANRKKPQGGVVIATNVVMNTSSGVEDTGTNPSCTTFGVYSDVFTPVFESEGGDGAQFVGSVVGCNSNNWNSNASARTANCNNHAGNSNDNYAGAFAVTNLNKFRGRPISRPSRSNTSDNLIDESISSIVSGLCEYDSIPFMDEEIAESKATKVLEDLAKANKKRKLKNLKRFFLDDTIIEMGFDRCMKHASKTKEIEWYKEHKSEILERIKSDLTNKTYEPKETTYRVIKRKGKGNKEREANIYDVYDRIIHNIVLIVIEQKFHNMMPRYVYSGIPERSMFSNNKTYCMVNQIRNWVMKHPDKYVMLTDVRHFYQSLRMDVVLDILFKTIKCEYTRWLLKTAFSKTEMMPIGGSLSQLMAMMALHECDEQIKRKWKVFYCAFGDNRLIGGNKEDVLAVRDFQREFYKTLGLTMKDDYQLHHVCNGFMFCKYHYKDSYVRPRAELRRRAIKARKLGWQHYAGYCGILHKVDAKYLAYQIEYNFMELKNKEGKAVPRFIGENKKLIAWPEGTKILLRDAKLQYNDKPSKYFYRINYITHDEKGFHCWVSGEGSADIKAFFDKYISDESNWKHKTVTIGHNTRSAWFQEFRLNKDDIEELLTEELKDIDF